MTKYELLLCGISILSLLCYAVIFLLLYPYGNMTTAALNLVPMAVFGWLLGVRGAFLYALLATPVNVWLFQWVGNEEASKLGPNVIGTLAFTLTSAGIGWVKGLTERIKAQARDLEEQHRLLQQEIAKRALAEEQLLHEALHDPLTGLPNRRLFLQRLEQAIVANKQEPAHFYAVLYLDLDRFKQINDTMGHNAGDQYLIKVASCLRTAVRPVDTVARMGGDEFAILLIALLTSAELHQILNQITYHLTMPCIPEQYASGSGASIGVVANLTPYEQIDDVLRDADGAMYRAKTQGGHRFEIFDTKVISN